MESNSVVELLIGDAQDAADGGRETFAGDVMDCFFLRPNQPFFAAFSSSSLTTMRSSVNSGSYEVKLTELQFYDGSCY